MKKKELEQLLTEAIDILKSIKLSIQAHPDCEEGSEFSDYVSIADEFIDKATK